MSRTDGRWYKSSHSERTNCVEVRQSAHGIQVRDSKDPAGPVLAFNHHEWKAFLAGAIDGEFDVPDPVGQ